MEHRNPAADGAIDVLRGERQVPIHTSCYPLEVIYRTCYAFTDRAYLWIEPGGSGVVVVCLTRKTGDGELEDLVGEFGNALIDFALRQQIRDETASMRDTIIRTALAEAVR